MQCESDPNIIYGGDLEDSLDDFKNDYLSLGHVVLSDLAIGSDRPSFINGGTDVVWTYNDLRKNTLIIANAFHGFGIKKNDTVAIMTESRHEFPCLSFGIVCLNGIVAPINTSYTERELLHALDLTKPKLIVASRQTSKKVKNVCRNLKYIQKVILLDDDNNVDDFALSLKNFVRKYEDKNFDVEKYVESTRINMKEQVTLILLSSGTTGLPKAVEITQDNILQTVINYREFSLLMKMLYEEDLVYFNIAPWFHTLGYISMFIMACSRTPKFVFLSKFEERVFLRAIEKNKVNVIVVVPPIMVMLAKSPTVDEYDISSIKEIGCGAAPLSAEIEEQVRNRLNQVMIRQGYGLSEATYSTLGASVIVKPGSVGQPVKGMYAKIVDENGNALGPNKVGELCFKGPRIMKGYLGNKNATNDMIDNDGWLRTGDLSYYDEDFQFFIVDRLKELIKYKAFQVAPAELEGLLLSHSKILDCGVIGISDELAGELPFAFVVKKPGVELTEQEVKDYVAKNASNAKWLRGGVKFINEIPKNPSGKILRRELRDLYKNTRSKL